MAGTTSGLEALLGQVLQILLLASGLAVAAALLLGLLLWRRLRSLDLPEDASLLETLQAVPLGFVVALDLLDFGLDVLAAPLSWLLLRRLRLQALRDLAVIEALLPGTQVLPFLTLAWILARAAPEAAIWRWPVARETPAEPRGRPASEVGPRPRLSPPAPQEVSHDEP